MKNIYLILIAIFLIASCAKKNQGGNESSTELESNNKEEAYKQEIADYDNYDLASLGIEDTKYFNPIEPGTEAPAFTLTDTDGQDVSLSSLIEDQNVALFFYRGYWCPACNKHLGSLAEEAEKLEEAGIRLVAITPEAYEQVEMTKEKSGANFTILSDPDAEVMKKYGVAFQVNDRYKGRLEKGGIELRTTEGGEVLLPVPATFVINQDGEVVYTHFDPKYTKRAKAEDMISAL